MSLNKTKIEWCQNPDGSPGYTFNPITGCLNGCEYCYARRLANTRLKQRYLANKNIAFPLTGLDLIETHQYYTAPFYPRFWEDRLHEPYMQVGKPKGIFVCDMSDLFGIGIPEEWTRKVLNQVSICKRHRFYLLTKQPQNLIKFSPFPDNAWVGVSATDSEMMYWAVSGLEKIQAKVKYLSLEPLLDWKSPKDWLVSSMQDYLSWAGIKWVIIGSQTKPYRPPPIEAVREIVEACDKAGIPVFLKDNLRGLIEGNIGKESVAHLIYHAGTHFSGEVQLRQEMPK